MDHSLLYEAAAIAAVGEELLFRRAALGSPGGGAHRLSGTRHCIGPPITKNTTGRAGSERRGNYARKKWPNW
ncbi:MAG TPA: hypothetical protein VKK79_21250 [Candidatus Lokiarchaeia archaeon]|nr:hypothetical protein [Candidatus Lokiarchaeia archaeon]